MACRIERKHATSPISATTVQGRNGAASPQHQFRKKEDRSFTKQSQEVLCFQRQRYRKADARSEGRREVEAVFTQRESRSRKLYHFVAGSAKGAVRIIRWNNVNK
jgi:hypothetical protein